MTRSTTAIFRANGTGFIQEMRKMNASTEKLERGTRESFRKMETQMARLRSSASVLFGGFSAVLAVREFGQLAEASTMLDNTLKAAGVSAEGFKKEVLATALEARAPIAALSNAFLRLNKIRSEDGASVNLERAATVQRLARVGGSTSAEAASVGTQLAQSLQSGFLAGDELKSLREAAPVELLKAIADQVGVTVGELKKAGAEGQITADKVLAAIDGLSEYSKEAIKSLDLTIADATTNVRSALTLFVGDVDRELGASSTIATTLDGFAKLMSESEEAATLLATSLKALAIGAVALGGARGIKSATDALAANTRSLEANVVSAGKKAAADRNAVTTARANLRQTRLNIIAANEQGATTMQLETLTNRRTRQIAALNAAQIAERASTVALTTAQTGLTLRTRAATAAMAGLRGVMNFFGGPIGLFVTAVSVLASFALSTNSATSAAERLAQSVAEVESATDGVKRAEDDLLEAIEARQRVVGTANKDELAQLDEKIKKGGEVLAQELDRLKIAQELNAQNLADSNRDVARDFISEGGFFPSARANAANALRDRVAQQDPEGSIRGELAGFEERLRLGEALNQKERDRVVVLQEQVEKIDAQIAGAKLVAEVQQRNAATLEPFQSAIADQIIANLNLTQATALAQTGLVANLDVITERMTKITELTAERALLEQAITDAQGGEDLERLNQLQIQLEKVNGELLRMNPIVQGSNETFGTMLTTVQGVIAVLNSVGFDEDGAVYQNALAAEQKLKDMEAAGLDVNAVTMEALRAEVTSVTDAANTAAGALLNARAEAVALSKERTQAFLHSRRFAGEEVVFGQEVAPVGAGEPAPAITPAQTRRGGGGGSRNRELTEEQKLLKKVDDAIKATTRSDEQRLTPLENIRALRERLLETYPAEVDRIAELTTAMEDLEAQGRATFLNGIKEDILGAIRAGDSFEDVLKKIGLRLLELAASNAIDKIAGAISGGSAKTGGGAGGFLGKIGGFIGGLFGFADGGIMTNSGPVPLRKYANGGIANSPQLAVFGEGDGPEAFIPLKNGAVPVTVDFKNFEQAYPDMAKLANVTTGDITNNANVGPVSVTYNVQVSGDDEAVRRDELQRVLRQSHTELLKAVKDLNDHDPSYLN